jgi:small subunit ribosomal protein S16
MAVRIRLARHGRKKRPFYWVVVAHSEAPRDGRFLEKLGIYDPLTDPARIELNMERVEYWLQIGAQPSDTVRSLIRQYKRRMKASAEEAKVS